MPSSGRVDIRNDITSECGGEGLLHKGNERVSVFISEADARLKTLLP